MRLCFMGKVSACVLGFLVGCLIALSSFFCSFCRLFALLGFAFSVSDCLGRGREREAERECR